MTLSRDEAWLKGVEELPFLGGEIDKEGIPP